MDSTNPQRPRSARRVQRSRKSLGPNDVWVGPGSLFFSPFHHNHGQDDETAATVEAFRCWITNGPQSPHWDEDNLDCQQWLSMVLAIPLLSGANVAADVPVDQPSYVDVLVELANQSVAPDGTPLAPVVTWGWTPAEPDEPSEHSRPPSEVSRPRGGCRRSIVADFVRSLDDLCLVLFPVAHDERPPARSETGKTQQTASTQDRGCHV